MTILQITALIIST